MVNERNPTVRESGGTKEVAGLSRYSAWLRYFVLAVSDM